MAVRTTDGGNVVAIFDSVSGFAFGPTFSTGEEAGDFLGFCAREINVDVRELTDKKLEELFAKWAKSQAPA